MSGVGYERGTVGGMGHEGTHVPEEGMSGIRLLIVDDDPDITAFIKLKLTMEARHFSIDTVESGRQCLDFIRENRVDCILSDYQMPEMDGMELLERLRESGYETPFIFITGQGNEEIAREAFKKGANDYFTKEIGFAHFPRVINSVEQAVRHRVVAVDKARAERELAEQRNKLEAMFTSITDGLAMVAPDFTILYQNIKLEEMTGSHVGEKCHWAYHGRTTVCEGCPVAMTFKDGNTHTVQRELLKDGRAMYFENTASPVRDVSGDIVACLEIVRDVTEHRMTDEALEQSGRKFRAIFESAMDGIVVVDPESRMYQDANGKFCSMLGYSRHEINGIGVMDAHPEKDLPSVLDTFQRAASGEISEASDIPVKRKDGSVFFADISGAVIELNGKRYLMGFFRDITRRKTAEEELLTVKKELELLLTHNPAVIYSCKFDECFTPTFISGNVKENYGYDPEEFIAEPRFWTGLMHPDDARRVLAEGAHLLLEKGQHVDEYRFLHKDGSYRWVRDYVNLIRDEQGNPVRVVGCMLDIDDMKRHQRRKEEFYSMVSHDLKSPLVAIQGYSDLILEGGVPHEELPVMASAINSSCKKVLGLLDDFLDISRFEAGRLPLSKHAVDAGGILANVKDELSLPAAKKDIDVRVEHARALPPAEVDEGYVHRAVYNLVQNAINYTPKGGKVTLRTELAVESGREFVVVEVSDTGPGIPAEEQAGVFDMYYRSGRTAEIKGSGIGLAIVKAVAEAHGGKVTVRSRVGEGAAFSLYLPVRGDKGTEKKPG